MSVGDSAKAFISIHALGRERLLVLSCSLPSHPLNVLFSARWETIWSFVSVFDTHVFQQKPDRRPPQITGHGLSAVHQGAVEAPNELATFSVHDAVVDFVDQSV